MNYLSVDDVLRASGALTKGDTFEVEGVLATNAEKMLLKEYGFRCVNVISMGNKLGEGVKMYVFRIEAPYKDVVLPLETVMQEMPRLTHTPVSFPGRLTELSEQILNAIGFICPYSAEEYITIVAKRNTDG